MKCKKYLYWLALLFHVSMIGIVFPQAVHAGLPVQVGVLDYYPLYDTAGDGEPESNHSINEQGGLFIRILDEIAVKNDWDVEYHAGSLAENIQMLESGEIDLLVAVAYSKETMNQFQFSRQNVISTWAQVYTREKPDIQSILDLDKHTIGVVCDDPYNRQLRNITTSFDLSCDFVEFRNYTEALNALANKWVDAAVVDRLFAERHKPTDQVVETPIIFSPVELRFACALDAPPDLLDVIDYHLTDMKNDSNSVYHQMTRRIFNEEANWKLLGTLKYGLIAASVLLMLFISMSLLLRHRIRIKTRELSIQNSQLEKEVLMRRQAEEALLKQKHYLLALNETSTGLIKRLELPELLEDIITRATSLTDANEGFIFIHDTENGDYELTTARGVLTEAIGLCVRADEGLTGQVVSLAHPVVIEDYAVWQKHIKHPALKQLKSVIGLPLVSGSRIFGVLGIGYTDKAARFSQDEIDILGRFSNLSSLVIDNALLYAKLGEELIQRKRAEDELVLLGEAIEQSVESVMITDTAGVIQYVNPSFERETGCQRHEVLGYDCVYSREIRERQPIGETSTLGNKEKICRKDRFTSRRKDGDSYHVEMTVSPVFNDQQEVTNYVCLRRDVTHELRLENQLRQAQKMEAIGTLAGGIAHDFNNMLFPIIGFTQIAQSSLAHDDRNRQRLGEVLTAATRAKDLVRQILTFSRKNDEEFKSLQVQPIIKEALKLMRASLPSTIMIQQRINEDCGCILGDATQIHQVIMNLCTNAYHAMRETGGSLTVTLDSLNVQEGDAHASLRLAPGVWLKISVSDTGHGMTREVMDRIFEPYYTTKKAGEGTGMGLAMVHGIINNYSGHISVYSEPGKGTSFNVYLPQIHQQEHKSYHEDIEPLPTGCERILIVDDEPQIARLLEDIFSGIGYRVTAYTRSEEAFDAFRMNPDDFDLVITDQTMPHLTGSELAQRIRAIRSDMPVILCTGFSELVTEESARALGIDAYVMKPIVRSNLARTIRNVLDKHASESRLAQSSLF